MNAFEALLSGDASIGGVAIIDPDDQQWLYDDVRTLVDHLAGFVEQSSDPQDHCLIYSDHSVFWVCNYLAIIRAGRIAVPVPPDATSDLLARIIRDFAPRLAFVDAPRLSSLLGHRCDGMRVISQRSEETSADVIDWTEALAFVPIERSYKPSAETTAARIYSVTATGDVKVVTLNHANITASTRALADMVSLSAVDRVMSMLPLLLGKVQAVPEVLHA